MSDRPADHCRIDQWLVAARFFKTRQLAVNAIKNGRVLIGGNRCKPARAVQIGEHIDIRKSPEQSYTVVVKVLETRRPSAAIAATFYEETADSRHRREALQEMRRRAQDLVAFPQQRPDKRERRQLRDIHRQS